MTFGLERRSVIAGLTLAGLVGCQREPEPAPNTGIAVTQPAQRLDLKDLEATHGGRLGLYAADNKAVAWRGEERFNYCSTFKLFLAAATLERVERGSETLDRAIPVTAADMIAHAPVTELAVGSTLTLEALCKATVEVSDNPAANILLREMGGLDALRTWYRGIGDMSTRVDRNEPGLNVSDGDKDTAQPSQIVADLGWILDIYQPLAIGSNYQLLWRWLIDSSTGMARIKAGVPQGWTVAHKTGTGGHGQTNDIGVVYPPSGEPVRIAIYYDAPESLPDADREAVIAEATRRALKALGHEMTA